ncbi:MAG: TetR/AcrR family transcriptional regulator [Deltaproteobacteria bacterium]|nr:TetR/AcrR family transcriptional regulator [Deltaproteobacteria bacterium]
MTPRPDVSADRKEQILGAAARVFAKLGFQKARMDDIVAASGLSKGALYWYFASKDDLIVGLLDRIFGGSVHQLEAALEEGGPVPAQLRRLAQTILHDVERSQALIPITYEFYVVAMRSKAVRRYIRAYYARYRKSLVRLLHQGQARGELRPELDADVAALSFVALIEGLILVWVIDPEAVRFPRDIAAAVEQSLQGMELAPTKGRKTEREKP